MKVKLLLSCLAMLCCMNLLAQPCDTPPAGTNACNAALICQTSILDSYCSTTGPPNSQTDPAPFCGDVNNNEWVAFVAASTNLNLQLNISNCAGTPQGSGIQAEIYSASNCANNASFVSVSTCFNTPGVSTGNVVATNLVVGQSYYLMIDGWAGDICDYSIDVISGSIGATAAAPQVPNGPSPVCPGISLNYTIPPVAGATSYMWTITGATLNPANPTGTSATVVFPPSGVPYSVTLCVKAINPCGSSTLTCKTIQVNPVVPINPPPVTLCQGDCVSFNGVNYCWGNGQPAMQTYNINLHNALGCDSIIQLVVKKIPPVTSTQIFALCPGESATVCGQTYNTEGSFTKICQDASYQGCDSTVSIVVLINNVLAAIAPPQTITCSMPCVTLNGIGSTGDGTLTYQWKNLSGTVIGTGPSVQVCAPGQYTLRVTSTLALPPPLSGNKVCFNETTVTVTSDAMVPIVPVVSGTSPVCAGDQVTYSVPADANATTHNWTVPAGATITAGQGTTSITVTWGTTGGNVCANAGNACGNSANGCFPVVVNDVPPPPTVTGSPTLCSPTASYSVTQVPGLTYQWQVPPGVSITSGQGTNTINVNWGAVTSGSICAVAVNGCGPSSQNCFAVSIGSGPPAPGAITGPTQVCSNSTTNYSIATVSGATSYTWSVPAGATITSGQGTTAITVNWTSSGNGQICVLATNSCGNSAPTCIAITGGAIPNAPGAITGPTSLCNNGTGTYTISSVPGALTYNWTVPAGATINSGQGTTSVSVTMGATPGSVCVTAANGCGTSPATCTNITLTTVPAQPGTITGPVSVCSGTNTTYSIANVATATSYTWSVPAGATITTGQGTNTINVNWGAAAAGAQLCVTANNTCGNSTPSCITVTVQAFPNAYAGANTLICGLTATLDATPTVGNGTWTHTAPGGALVNYTNPNLPNSGVTVSVAGIYHFIWTENNNNCTDADTVQITFSSLPQASAITETCDATNTMVTISFTISGGTAPYNVFEAGTNTSAGIVTGNVFTSFNLPSGPYSFDIFDSNGCGPTHVSGTKICNCTSNAGQMSSTPLTSCDGQTVTAQHIAGTQVLDANDVAEYILHTNSGTSLGVVIARNGSGTFPFIPVLMQYGVTYYISYVVGDNNGTGQVLTTGCFSVSPGQPVTFYQTPNANAGSDGAICGLSYTLNAIPSIGFGTWTQTSGLGTAVFSNPSFAGSDVSVDQCGTYTFRWTENNNNCTDFDEVTVVFNCAPIAGPIAEDCNNTGTAYTVSFTINGGAGPYQVQNTIGGASAGTVTGTSFVSGNITNGVSYNFTIIDGNGCHSDSIVGSNSCQCISDAGTMNLTPLSICSNNNATAQHNGDQVLDGNDTSEYILHTNPGAALGTIISRNHTGVFSFIPVQMNYGQTYYMSFVVGNDSGNSQVDVTDACLDVAQGQPVTFIEQPVANAGADGAICGLTYSLNALPGGVGTGTWSLGTGPAGGTASFTQPNSPGTSVDVSLAGSYTFFWTMDNNGCSHADPVDITFNSLPQITNLNETCNATATQYTVTFDIVSGTAPYSVLDSATLTVVGTVNGNAFVSNLINTGAPYHFVVRDINGCESPFVSGLRLCNCITSIGNLNTTQLNLCEDQTAVASYTPGGMLDGNDVLEYVLHTGNVQTGTLFSSPVNSFTFQAPLQYETTYYLSVIAGDNDGNGHVNLSDPCAKISQNQPVVFHQIPDATIGNNVSICAGDCASLTINLTGNAPFTVTFSDGSTQVINSNLFVLNECPAATTTYCITNVQNAFCSNNINACATITVNPPVSATVTQSDQVCNTDESGFITTRDFSAYVTAGDVNGTWSGTLPPGATGSFPVIDFNGAQTGVYVFTYTLNSAVAPCTNPSYNITITVTNNCACPDITTLPPSGAICNNNGTLDLSTLLTPTTAAGSWSIISSPGNPSATINGNTFNAINAASGAYQVQYTLLTPPPGTCPDHSIQTINVNDSPEAGTALPPYTLCQGLDTLFSLPTLVNGSDPGGTWTETSAIPSTNGAFNPLAATFNTAGQQPGTYTFNYTIPAVAPCTNDFATVTITINATPTAQAGADGILTCNLTSISLGNPGVDPNLSYTWTKDGVPYSLLPQPVVSQPGTYILTVAGITSGCFDKDTAVISQNITPPVASILQNIQTLTCALDTFNLNGAGSTPNGQLNFIWSYNGSIIGSNNNYTAGTGGYYILRVIDQVNGCNDTAMVYLPEDRIKPTLNVVTPALLTCQDTLVTVNATASSSGPGFSNLWWSPNGNIVSGATGLTPVVDEPGFYHLVITNTTNQCVDSTIVAVGQDIVPPVAQASVSGQLDCVTSQVTLTGIGSSIGFNIQYQWYTNNGHLLGSGNQLNENADAIGLYYILVTNTGNGCVGLDSIDIAENLNVPNAVDIAIDEPTCYGDCDASFEINQVTGGTAPYLFSLDGGQVFTSVDSFAFLCAGAYNLVVQDATGCEYQTTVTINQPPQLDISLGQDTTIELGDSLLLVAIPNIPDGFIDTLIWSGPYLPGCDSATTSCQSQWITPLQTSDYAITLVDTNGCFASDYLTVYVDKKRRIFIPNVFSPNGDGVNDIIYIHGGQDVKNIKSFRIFDRWGEVMFERNDILPDDPYNGWDGRHRGKAMNPQVFVYWAEVEYLDGRIELYRGDITLRR